MRKQLIIVGTIGLALLLTLALGIVLGATAQPQLSTVAAVPQAPAAALVQQTDDNQADIYSQESATAVTNPMISYQGKLYQNGVPLNDAISVTFSLYNLDISTTPIWTETQVISVENGLFHVMLGSIEPLNWLAAKSTSQVWLGIWPEGAASELTPRQPLGATAYAFNVLPGATMLDMNPAGEYGYSFWVRSQNHSAIYGRSQAAGGVGVYGSSDYDNGGYFKTSSNDQYALAAEGNYGAIITGTNGIGLRVKANTSFAIQSEGNTDDGVFGWSHGITNTNTGLTGRGDSGYGIYGWSYKAGQYGGYFDDPIYVNGGCTGCALRYVGRNTSDTTLRPGDAVGVAGMDAPLEGLDTPVIQVTRATPGQSILGVVVGRTTVQITGGDDESVQPGAHFGPVIGDAASGDYLVIVVQGPVLVNVEPGSSIQPGDTLYLGTNGATLQSGTAVLGIALSAANADGQAWIMIGLSR